MKKILGLLGSAICLLAYFSCKKDKGDDGNQPPKHGCQLVSAKYYQNAAVYDSSTFSYTGDKAMKAESDLKLVTYTYNGANITSRSFFDKVGQKVAMIDTTEYDANNKIKKMTVWLYPGRFSQDTTRTTYTFTYNGNTIDKIMTTQRHYSLGPTVDTVQNIFHVNGSGNTESIATIDKFGNLRDSVHFSFDNNTNYFSKINPNYFLFDVNFQLQGSYLHHLPYFNGANNVKEFSYSTANTYPVSYQLDSLKNLTEVDVAGAPYATYKYQCQ